MRTKRMKMGGVESFEHVQNPATAIQDHRYLQTVIIRSCDVHTTSIRPVTDL